MGEQEFARVLEGMVGDADVAGRVAQGDFADADGELTEAEQALLSAAAGDLDDNDVVGFWEGEVIPKLEVHNQRWKVSYGGFPETPNMRSALGYLKLGDIKGE